MKHQTESVDHSKANGQSAPKEIVIIKIKKGKRGWRDTWVTLNLPAWVVLLIVVCFTASVLIMMGSSPSVVISIFTALAQLANTFKVK